MKAQIRKTLPGIELERNIFCHIYISKYNYHQWEVKNNLREEMNRIKETHGHIFY